MVNQIQTENSQLVQPPLSTELRSVISILAADDELKIKALPHVDLQKCEVNWDEIFKKDFGFGHRVALIWAKALFQGKRPMKADPFERASAMDLNLRRAVATALEIQWRLVQ